MKKRHWKEHFCSSIKQAVNSADVRTLLFVALFRYCFKRLAVSADIMKLSFLMSIASLSLSANAAYCHNWEYYCGSDLLDTGRSYGNFTFDDQRCD